jgi:bifunctional UDP-N-acetylglucosamine pyrophosphorylase/glucosamine-1-phosphate N-acetyltransferase
MSSAAQIAPLAVILAAGQGTRMKSRHPKALHRILGKPLVYFPVELCRALGISRILIVVPPGGAVQAALGASFEYVEQAEPLGAADALRTALSAVPEFDGPVLCLPAHLPLVTVESARELLERHLQTGASTLLAGVGVLPCVLTAPTLAATLRLLAPNSDPDADTVSDVFGILAGRGQAIETLPPRGPELGVRVVDRNSLAHAAGMLRSQICREHMLNGVTIEDPVNTYIEPGVTIGQDTVIRPQSFLGARTVIGEECEIGPFVRISNCWVRDRVSIQSAVLADSEVGDDTRIGPFAQLRPGCKVGRKVKIGNFVELKNTIAEDGVSMGHFAYLGDAFIGEKSNIGAGTITCNYDGKKKHRTHIGRHTFVGTHATLVAPVTVGDGAFIAAGSVITEEVPADALAIGRGRQVNKPDWAKQRRERE